MSTIISRLLSGQLSRNSLFAFGQTIFVTLSLFLVYRLVIMQVGLGQLGIWSLLLAGSAFARIGDVSGAGALSRFVAMRSYRGHDMWARDTVHTVLITSFAFNAGLSLVLWLVAPLVLTRFVDPAFLTEATMLVPFAIGNMFLGALAVAVTSGIDGAQRADQRALVMIAAAVFFVVAGFVLVPMLGILGFAIAQLMYQSFILLVAWLVLRSHIPGLGWLPWHWRRRVFLETTGYALKLNSIGVMIMLFEPLVKFAFNSIGGPGSVALYDLASRLVLRVRDLATAAALPLIPAFAAHANANAPEIRTILLKVTRLAAMAAIFNTIITLALAPLISFLMLGRISSEFLVIVAALSAGRNLQLSAFGYYLAAQGQGILRWNFLSHATIAAFAVLGVYTLAPSFGTSGLLFVIVAGFIMSMVPAFLGNARSLQAAEILGHSLAWAGTSGAIILALVALYLTLGGIYAS